TAAPPRAPKPHSWWSTRSSPRTHQQRCARSRGLGAPAACGRERGAAAPARLAYPVLDECPRIGEHGVERAPPRVPPLHGPIQRTDYEHLRDVEIKVGAQLTRPGQIVDQPAPNFAVPLFLGYLAF